ncbi:MAG: DNA polymerase III subunit chi [Pseudomonadales bacterium]
MTRVDFYVLQDVAISALYRFACRLASKAVRAGHQVIMHTKDEQSASEVDELLWHYPDRRFLPHCTQSDGASTVAPIVVTWCEPPRYDGVLVNLTRTVPEFFGRFDRVAEIVVQDTREEGRDRYKFYRDRGFPLYHHELDDWETDQTAT